MSKNIVGPGNKASFERAMSLGLDMQKCWLTCGKQDVRDKHKHYESLGPVPMDYEFAPGLKFPGDPDCMDPDETDGCRCTIIYEVD